MLSSLTEPFVPLYKENIHSDSIRSAADDPVLFIDNLLQDTWLFVMDIYHQPALVRDEAFYRRGVQLVEQAQERLQVMKASETFRQDVLLAQCVLVDHVVLGSASWDDNVEWLHAPLQSVWLHTMRAAGAMENRTRQLLREVSPDMRLLALHQRVYSLGFGRFETPEVKQQYDQMLDSLNALVPAGEQPLSAALVVERRPGVRGTLLHSRLLHIGLALLVTACLAAGLHVSLSHLLQAALPG